MAKMIHSMIRVRDEQASLAFYEKAFGLRIADRIAFDTFTLVYLANDEQTFELELTINNDRDRPYDLGDGYGHLAVSTDNLTAEHARFEREGLNPQPVKELAREGRVIGRFFFVSDPDGYKIEVLQRGAPGRFL
ncbi:VOC family protein [Acetobacter oeni]|uniref:Lactoylglutathione lyase n=1 Tax=Acetobacter oeni TaxID=304077 RepID=A0A511XHQ1_9PROT|nr:VOC family protein [Acetobacter oeni]MBB3881294.1 lactoylglutathione lyase [Acetobacter oeni]NHO18169.1 lactoylglutathione lyase [Acetobacter oeni]GBR08061.1 lactoylglutathione lyase [Acetobacter oeni LMG 21952]GEN62449.1 lactoylglutathione lyase [Acetobacter oeni]